MHNAALENPHSRMLKTDFATVDNGQLTVVSEFLPSLRAAGLDSMAGIMALASQNVVRAVPGRSTVRVSIAGATGFLKRYELRYLTFPKLLLRLLRWPGDDDEASREWRKILLLRDHSFLTATPIALGQQRSFGVVTSSFLLQREIERGVPADEYLQTLSVPRRRRLLRQFGALARRLHDAGFIHKDLYLKHIFVVERANGWDLFLIDLQRVLGPRRHRRRWYVKDLGALAHSARARAQCTRSDLLRMYRAYAGVDKLQRADKLFIGKIWRRVQRLRQRPPKYRRVWNAPAPSGQSS